MAKNAKTRSSKQGVKPARRPSSAKTRRPWLSLMLKLAVVMLVVAVAGLVYLDAFVRERFDSHVWQLPARVYANPVELYEGRVLAEDSLEQLLTLMRYRRVADPSTPGSYHRQGQQWTLYTRGFRDSDGAVPARRVSFTLRDGAVRQLRMPGNGAVVRLEPLQVGSIHPQHAQDRVLVPLSETPELLITMLLATEDRAFFEHRGVSFRGLARAMVANLKAGGVVQGGSTLTQQLVKNFWLTSDRNLSRKLLELPMALLLEWHYSKPDILEAYLNEVYLGQDGSRAIHGMGLGAQFMFGRPLKELEPHQLATLVALLKGPSWFDPRRHPQRALQRRNTVLQVAHEVGGLDDDALARYQARDLEVVPRGASALYAFPAFIDLVRRQLARDYPAEVLSSEGLQIHTTLDVLAQLAAEASLREHLDARDPGGRNDLNGAVVLVAPAQGDVLALVSNRRSRQAGFNRSLDAVRSVGSLLKPAVVLAALRDQAHDYHLGSLIDDSPIIVRMENNQEWSPSNFDETSMGPMPMVDVLALSRNQGTAHLGLAVGLDVVAQTLRDLGVQRPIPLLPSLLLGSLEMSPFEVAMMYQPLATGGFSTPLRSIIEVMDKQGEPMARYPVTAREVIDGQNAFLTQWAMEQVMTTGTGVGARRHLPADLRIAGKTGTSGSYRDAWFAGFSGNHLGVVWVGKDDNGSTGLTGSSGALPVWASMMSRLPQRGLPERLPAGISWQWLSEDGLQRSGEGCDGARRYPMRDDRVPKQADRCAPRETQSQDDDAPGGVRGWFRGIFN